MKKRKPCRKEAFTLIEIIVVVGIISVCFLTLS
ncbi:prepilin-type N-terminal cleavage/methylation domain-containing protein, partial [Candidatus Aerophobetes bacterium]|nr:prepilin-type N-terminal cleavage/methylation domain-containing protein [Candidatus Aerophobetes bacterium]